MPGGKADAAHLRVSAREQLKVRNVAVPEQAEPQFGVAHRVRVLPAEHPPHPTVTKLHERFADVAQNRRCRREAHLLRMAAKASPARWFLARRS